jgi:octanoyl-[GcvH]:protein N-octanoyltransferase
LIVELLQGGLGRDPALEVALSAVLLHAVAGGERRPVLRCYRPQRTVAFGRRDTFLSGFVAAARTARQDGFAPVIRAPGGRAAAYDEGCLVVEEIMPAADSLAGIQERFGADAERYANALRRLGIDALVGQVPGEYCPGAFTVNAAGRRKLIGAAQRAVRGGWLLSTLVVIDTAARVRRVLQSVYATLELDWDPETVGAVAEEVPGVTPKVVERLILDDYSQRYDLVPASVSEQALVAAREEMPHYQVTGQRTGPMREERAD